MPQYQVLRPIEYNGRLYLLAGHASPGRARSAGNGSEITVDTTGVIVLSESEATAFTFQQIRPLPTVQAGPTPIPEHAIAGTNPTPIAEVNKTPAQPAGPTPIPELKPVTQPAPVKGK